MLVKLKTTMAGPDGAWAAGAVVEFERATAETLIDAGYAEAVGAAAKETDETPANAEAAKPAAAKPEKPAKPAAAKPAKP